MMRYDVTKYGIIGDGETNNTALIKKLIESLKEKGGTVYFPKGKYVTGTITLYSNMSLYLDDGCEILASSDIKDYQKIQLDGYTRGGFSGIVTAYNAENITIEGSGKIDGRGYNWWKSMPSDLLRPRTINPILCKNVEIKDITVVNSPCWTVHPMCCENVVIDSVKVTNPYDSPNTDGINPESCKNVTIKNCYIDVGDDCVTLKSGTETDLLQKRYPCENITVTSCVMAHGHGGLVIGSEMSGGVKNVTVSNCTFKNTDRGIRIKTRRKRGGFVENINISDITMDNIMAAFTINEFYRCGADLNDPDLPNPEKLTPDEATPRIQGITLDKAVCRNVRGVGIYINGLPEMPVRDITIKNIDMEITGTQKGIEPIMAFERLRSYGEGIYLKNASTVNISDIGISCPKEKITVIQCENVDIKEKY